MRFVVAVCLSLACKEIEVEDPSAPRCADVGKRVFEIMSSAGNADAAPEDNYVALCKQPDFTTKRKRCYVSANTRLALAQCDREDKIDKGADMGGPDCDEVWKRYVDASPPDESQRKTWKERVALICTRMTRSQKLCWMKATDVDAMLDCGKR